MHEITVNGLLDAARNALALKSDYALGKALGISLQKMGNWRHGRATPDEKACEILARAAGLDPDVVVAQVNAMRANEPQARAIWERIAARLSVAAGGLAAVILSAVCSVFLVAPDAYAASAKDGTHAENDELKSLYIVQYGLPVLFLVLLVLALRFDASFLPAWVPAK